MRMPALRGLYQWTCFDEDGACKDGMVSEESNTEGADWLADWCCCAVDGNKSDLSINIKYI